jgi:hypothetical protein
LWKHLERNRSIAKYNRHLYFHALMMLLYDRCNRNISQSFFSWLPTEIFIKILASIQFADLGITPSQGNALLKFVFDNSNQIFKRLVNRSGVKIEIDPVSRWHATANNRYRFYQPIEPPPVANASWLTMIADSACSIQ